MLLCLIFLLLFVSVYYLHQIIVAHNPIKLFQQTVVNWEKQRLFSGNRKKGYFEKFLDNLDEQIEQAGIKRLFPRAATEIFCIFCAIEFVLVFNFASNSISKSFVTACAAILLNKLWIDALRYRNMKVTDKHLLELLNFISDYSMFEQELTLILYRAGRNLPYPLGNMLQKCHIDAQSNGDTKIAYYELRRSINHPIFREVMLLLEFCSQSNGDYPKVINDCRNIVHRYLQEEQKKATTIKQLLGEAVLLIVIALYTLAEMISSFAADAGFHGGLFDFFINTSIGQITLVIYFILALMMFYTILKFGERK